MIHFGSDLIERILMFANIIILALLGLAIVDGFGCSPHTSFARRGKIHKMWARGCERAQETRSLKERRATTKFFRKVFANAGILTGSFLPGRAVAAQRVPAALEAKENKARQNPRDVWSGARRGIISEEPSSTTTAKIPLYNSGMGKVSATGTFVSERAVFYRLPPRFPSFFPQGRRLFTHLTSKLPL